MNSQKPGTTKHGSSSEENQGIGGNLTESVNIHGDGNTVYVTKQDRHEGGTRDGKNTAKLKRKKGGSKKPQKPNYPIIAAWIGFAAVILGAVITGVMGWFPFASVDPSPTAFIAIATETSLPPTTTDTATLEPTFTPTPVDTATATPLPTDTPVPPIAIGEDWLQGCISQSWRGYPPIDLEAKGNGCWQEPVYVFSARDGSLSFLSERNGGEDAEIYGLFTLLPESGKVTFTIQMEALENADVLMGVFPQPDVNSQGLLMVIPNGDVERNIILQKDPNTYETMLGTVALYQGDGFSLSFIFDTLSVTSKVNPNIFVTNQVPMNAPQKWLFFGYKGLRGSYRIEGAFFDFQIEE
ncbi:MAG: hypothetical protein J0M11_08535 [Anaerolineae bacterium]|nr:hypothetical protein [Anaerolineae bacterium]